MTDTPSLDESAAAKAARDLSRLQAKVADAQALLVRLLQEVVVAASHADSLRTAELLEANEQLVVTALRSQTEAQSVKQAMAEVKRAAEIDPLTKLPNRVLLLDRIAQAIAAAKRHGARTALLFVDLNEFKKINDAFGHAVGDEVLQHVAQRLSAVVRAADTVSRYGGDEFLILLTEVSQPEDAGLIADKLLIVLGAPCEVNGHVLRLTASVGISIYPDDGEDITTLVDRADAAMYRAKHSVRSSFAFHGPGATVTPNRSA
jgi:diguanylate cyclase (GGDEF)-like protein